MTPEDIVRTAEERGLQLVRFLYCDNGGVIRGKSTHVGGLCPPDVERDRAREGHAVLHEPRFPRPGRDLRAGRGDPAGARTRDTFVVLPYAPRSGQMIANMVELDHQPWALDPRHFLQRMVAAAAATRASPSTPPSRTSSTWPTAATTGSSRSTGACASARSGWSRPSR